VTVSTSNVPAALPRFVADTPGVVTDVASVGLVPVSEFSATEILFEIACFPLLPENVSVTVPIPAVSVPAVAVIVAPPNEGRACKAVLMFASKVAFVADHVIEAVVKPSKANLNVPPVGVPPMVSVSISLVPFVGALVVRLITVMFLLLGYGGRSPHNTRELLTRYRLRYKTL
jgi:hypothetical protein